MTTRNPPISEKERVINKTNMAHFYMYDHLLQKDREQKFLILDT